MKRTRRLAILIYHRVLPSPDLFRNGDVDVAGFDDHMRTLARWFRVLPLPDAAARLREGSLPAGAVSITFDDGYADNHDIALPVLRRYGLSATFFVATAYLNGGRMFNDTVIESLRNARGRSLDLSARGLGVWNLETDAACCTATAQLLAKLKYLPFAERTELADWIARQTGGSLPDDLMMTSDQVRALHSAGMVVGAHTVSHPILTRLQPDEAADEIGRSREELEGCIGAPVTTFAYPNGRPGQDYDMTHTDAVRRAGYDCAVSTAWGSAGPGDDRFQLPRIAPWDRTALRFGLRVVRSYWQPGHALMATADQALAS